GGTLFLDEIGELPLSMQVKLLRVVQERMVRRVGEQKERPIDLRLVAATNQDLQSLVEKGDFREDLFFRLNVVRIHVPPLRERREDIPSLAQAFLLSYSEELGKTILGIEKDAMAALLDYDFPGNVRELQNFIERAVSLTEHEKISRDDLSTELKPAQTQDDFQTTTLPEEGLDIKTHLEKVESDLIKSALQRTGGSLTLAAKLLGLKFRIFRYRVEKLGIEKPTKDKK
ncbi:sigma 54-interacting transcriptional regulator, partial [Myxococcota bacterium]|nr:sigma 54-interacting transcriptional regulator [Myxococcota bacterium]